MSGARGARRAVAASSMVSALVAASLIGAAAVIAPVGAAVAEAFAASPTADTGSAAGPPGGIDVAVVMGAGEQSGEATASVRIHAPQAVVWRLLTTCAEELNIIPGLEQCEVVETAADQSWQIIRHRYHSWYMPRVNYIVRATYAKPSVISFERISGDLVSLRGAWRLQTDGEFTVAHYVLQLEPGFWVPHWIVRAGLKHDLPKMLQALRTRAEALRTENPG